MHIYSLVNLLEEKQQKTNLHDDPGTKSVPNSDIKKWNYAEHKFRDVWFPFRNKKRNSYLQNVKRNSDEEPFGSISL